LATLLINCLGNSGLQSGSGCRPAGGRKGPFPDVSPLSSKKPSGTFVIVAERQGLARWVAIRHTGFRDLWCLFLPIPFHITMPCLIGTQRKQSVICPGLFPFVLFSSFANWLAAICANHSIASRFFLKWKMPRLHRDRRSSIQRPDDATTSLSFQE